MIFPVRTEVTSNADGGATLDLYDHPQRKPIETVELSREASRQLLDDLVRTLHPMEADEILARLP